MKVFITGCTSLVGREVMSILNTYGDVKIKCFVRNPEKCSFLGGSKLEFFKGDFLDLDSVIEGMRGCDAVIHIAGIMFIENVLVAMKKNNVKKGLLHLVGAARNIIASFRDVDIKFILVGDGEQREELCRKVFEYSLQDFFVFAGYRKDISELLTDFDIFVLPSLWEGLPLALVEAMASGLPCVVTDVSGNSEAVVDGETGFIIQPGDALALVNAIIKLVQDKTLRKMMGERPKMRALEIFTAESMATQYKLCYLEALELVNVRGKNE